MGMMPSQTSMNNHIMPVMLPQINDPRIIVQTFNAPNPPLLPGALPQPKITMNVEMPKQKAKTVIVHRKVVHVAPSNKEISLENKLRKEFRQEFRAVLGKNQQPGRAHARNGMSVYPKTNFHNPSLFLADTATERYINEITAQNRIEAIVDRILALKSGYKRFQAALDTRMEHLGKLAYMAKTAANSVIV